MVMNAGAYGGEMKDVTEEVTVLTEKRRNQNLKKRRTENGIPDKHHCRKRLSCAGSCSATDRRRSKRNPCHDGRSEEKADFKQPLEYPSAGSTFKRPKGYFAGKLIMDAGLRGFQVGGAQVSEKHCGFVINTGDATAEDVTELIRQVAERVKSTKWCDTGAGSEITGRILNEICDCDRYVRSRKKYSIKQTGRYGIFLRGQPADLADFQICGDGVYTGSEIQRVALGVDVRSGEALGKLEDVLEGMAATSQKYEILFLDAADEVLVKRYKETRRTHPLARGGRVTAGSHRSVRNLRF